MGNYIAALITAVAAIVTIDSPATIPLWVILAFITMTLIIKEAER